MMILGGLNLSNSQHIFKHQLFGTLPTANDTYTKTWSLEIFSMFDIAYFIFGGNEQLGVAISLNLTNYALI